MGQDAADDVKYSCKSCMSVAKAATPHEYVYPDRHLWGKKDSKIAIIFVWKSDLVGLLQLLSVLLHHRLIDCNLRRCQSRRLDKEEIRVAHELLCQPLQGDHIKLDNCAKLKGAKKKRLPERASRTGS